MTIVSSNITVSCLLSVRTVSLASKFEVVGAWAEFRENSKK
jgi:hypothetical protein